ncbi:MAG: type IX secretion system membrane protein PorP/SprF, partial [Bacteroidales bacterium]|nr:type IX secretion system membrane protein PorP/SprF [Bacteroidales bacterium]
MLQFIQDKHRRFVKLSTAVCMLVLALASPSFLSAQQEPQFSQYMFNRLSYNPGYAGSNGAMCLTGFYRNQWMGMGLTDVYGEASEASSGETMNFSFDMPVRFLHGGIGATIISDKIGFRDNIHAKIDYAFRIQFPIGNLAIGVEAQLFNSTLDKSHLIGADQITQDDQVGTSSDPVLGDLSEQSDFLFDLGAGIYYQIPGKLYIGLSTSKLLETSSENLYWDNRRFYYILAGYEWALPAYPSLRLLPSALLKTDFVSKSAYQLDASLLMEWEHKIWGGMTYRVQDAIVLMGGVAFGDFKLGISYDIPTSRISTQSFGSLELFARFCFKIENPPKPPTIYRNTRR